MTEKETKQISKFLSLVLRHRPEYLGLALDSNGWTDVQDLIQKANKKGKALTPDILNHVVENNNKKRFAFNKEGDKIRASQGHSIKIELGYEPQTPPDILYHGTAAHTVDSILATGLQKRKRHHVHLSKDTETATNVGTRHGKPVILEVFARKMHADGFEFFISENGVWLTDHIPTMYLKRQE